MFMHYILTYIAVSVYILSRLQEYQQIFESSHIQQYQGLCHPPQFNSEAVPGSVTCHMVLDDTEGG